MACSGFYGWLLRLLQKEFCLDLKFNHPDIYYGFWVFMDCDEVVE